jgi:hypothetical protein
MEKITKTNKKVKKKLASNGSTVVRQSTHDHKFKGSKQAATSTRMEKITKTNKKVKNSWRPMVAQW